MAGDFTDTMIAAMAQSEGITPAEKAAQLHAQGFNVQLPELPTAESLAPEMRSQAAPSLEGRGPEAQAARANAAAARAPVVAAEIAAGSGDRGGVAGGAAPVPEPAAAPAADGATPPVGESVSADPGGSQLQRVQLGGGGGGGASLAQTAADFDPAVQRAQQGREEAGQRVVEAGMMDADARNRESKAIAEEQAIRTEATRKAQGVLSAEAKQQSRDEERREKIATMRDNQLKAAEADIAKANAEALQQEKSAGSQTDDQRIMRTVAQALDGIGRSLQIMGGVTPGDRVSVQIQKDIQRQTAKDMEVAKRQRGAASDKFKSDVMRAREIFSDDTAAQLHVEAQREKRVGRDLEILAQQTNSDVMVAQAKAERAALDISAAQKQKEAAHKEADARTRDEIDVLTKQGQSVASQRGRNAAARAAAGPARTAVVLPDGSVRVSKSLFVSPENADIFAQLDKDQKKKIKALASNSNSLLSEYDRLIELRRQAGAFGGEKIPGNLQKQLVAAQSGLITSLRADRNLGVLQGFELEMLRNETFGTDFSVGAEAGLLEAMNSIANKTNIQTSELGLTYFRDGPQKAARQKIDRKGRALNR